MRHLSVVLVVATMFASTAQGTTYKAFDETSMTANPSGVWSLGYMGTLGGTFTAYTRVNSLDLGTGFIFAWDDGVVVNPLVGKNASCCDWLGVSDVLHPAADFLHVHPGPVSGGKPYSVVRFTAPEADQFDLSTTIKSINIAGAPPTVDFHVLVNNVSIFDITISATGDSESFSSTVTLDAGDTIDFVVGPNGTHYSDSTGLFAEVSNACGGPVVEPPNIPIVPVAVGTGIAATADFESECDEDDHDVLWDWGDLSSSGGTVDDGINRAFGTHTYAEPGVYIVTATVSDGAGNSGEASSVGFVVVYDPSGSVSGGGMIDSPIGAYVANPSLTGVARFGFVSKYTPGANTPTGRTKFAFKAADFKFESTSYDWLVVAGHKAMYKGDGEINGFGNYGFQLSAIDARLTSSTDVDLFRIRIWDKDTEALVYDNKVGETDDNADPTTAVFAGMIRIGDMGRNKASVRPSTWSNAKSLYR